MRDAVVLSIANDARTPSHVILPSPPCLRVSFPDLRDRAPRELDVDRGLVRDNVVRSVHPSPTDEVHRHEAGDAVCLSRLARPRVADAGQGPSRSHPEGHRSLHLQRRALISSSIEPHPWPRGAPMCEGPIASTSWRKRRALPRHQPSTLPGRRHPARTPGGLDRSSLRQLS